MMLMTTLNDLASQSVTVRLQVRQESLPLNHSHQLKHNIHSFIHNHLILKCKTKLHKVSYIKHALMQTSTFNASFVTFTTCCQWLAWLASYDYNYNKESVSQKCIPFVGSVPKPSIFTQMLFIDIDGFDTESTISFHYNFHIC